MVIVDPQGRQDTVEVALEDKGDSTFRCTYRPVMEGPHTVHVAFAGAPITRSPFPVHVAEGKSLPPSPTDAVIDLAGPLFHATACAIWPMSFFCHLPCFCLL